MMAIDAGKWDYIAIDIGPHVSVFYSQIRSYFFCSRTDFSTFYDMNTRRAAAVIAGQQKVFPCQPLAHMHRMFDLFWISKARKRADDLFVFHHYLPVSHNERGLNRL